MKPPKGSEMGILDQLSSATGQESSNLELADQCLKTPVLLHTIAEGLRTGTPPTRVDCIKVLVAVGEKRADLLGDFVVDLLDASRSGNPAVEKLAYQALLAVTPVKPSELFSERERLLEIARAQGGAAGGGAPRLEASLGAAQILAALCAENANYRGKLAGVLFRVLATVPEKDLARWVAAVGAAVDSADALKRLGAVLDPRLVALPEAGRKKVEKALLKLERAAARPKR